MYRFVLLLCLFFASIALASGTESKVNLKLLKNDKPFIAVHDFTLSSDLTRDGINGWAVAELLENRLLKTGKYRVITRAKLSKVLKEKNVTSGNSFSTEKLVGADYIITGNISKEGDILLFVGKLIDVKKQTGEILKSIDIQNRIINGNVPDAIHKSVNELVDFIEMTPGELLDYGIEMMKDEYYYQALSIFKELKRVVPAENIQQLLNEYSSTPDSKLPQLKFLSSQKTPGELLDYGLKVMNQGKIQEAVVVFRKMDMITPFDKIKNLFFMNQTLKTIKNELSAQNKCINSIIKNAGNLFTNAKEAVNNNEISEIKLCDEAVLKLNSLLEDPKYFISFKEKTEIESLITKIDKFKSKITKSPTSGNQWLIPDINIVMIPVEHGNFMMDTFAKNNLTEKHRKVEISKNFWIDNNEITISQFLYYLRHSGHKHNYINWRFTYLPVTDHYKMKEGKGKTWGNLNQPIVGISWKAADNFCKWLTERERIAKRLPDGYEYRLPTEAEWEYCALTGGKKLEKDDLMIDKISWFSENSKDSTNIAGTKKPNKWGIKDLYGNVWEWCYDWYSSSFSDLAVTDPEGPVSSPENLKVIKGGSFATQASDFKRSKDLRKGFNYRLYKKNIGFRIVCAPEIA